MAIYDRHYRADPHACGAPFPEFVAIAEQVSGPGIRVLDLGCGQGRDALLFAQLGCSVLGLDASTVGIAQLRERAAGLDLRAEVVDLEDWAGAAEPFDVVLLDRVLHMLSSDEARSRLLGQAMDAVAPGGCLLVADGPKHRELIRGALHSADWTLFKDRSNRTFARRPGG